MSQSLLGDLAASVAAGDEEAAVRLTRLGLDQGIEPTVLVQDGMTPGMNLIGARYASGECFIPHLVMAGKAMKAAMRLVEPELRRSGKAVQGAGVAVLGTVRGDIHEIGKSLVGVMLAANGFDVHDLGVDVPAEAFVDEVRRTGAVLLGLSALLTTTMVVQRRVIEALRDAGLRQQVKVMVGGAPVTRAWAEEIGADGYAEDAAGAVAVAKDLLGLAP